MTLTSNLTNSGSSCSNTGRMAVLCTSNNKCIMFDTLHRLYVSSSCSSHSVSSKSSLMSSSFLCSCRWACLSKYESNVSLSMSTSSLSCSSVGPPATVFSVHCKHRKQMMSGEMQAEIQLREKLLSLMIQFQYKTLLRN